MLKLEFPSEKHREMYDEMMQKWSYSETIPTDPWRLFDGNNFDEFLEMVHKDIESNSLWVNSHLFFLTDTIQIFWAIQIRHHINHPNLIETWWHIWYGIAPWYRKQWYASQMLEYWLKEAKKLWLQQLLLTCDIDNIWSNKVIIKNNGVFERKTKDQIRNRYWIDIK